MTKSFASHHTRDETYNILRCFKTYVSIDNLRIIVGKGNLVMSKCNYHDYMPIKGLETMLVL